MSHRYAFMKNRTAHLLNTGLSLENADKQAHLDYKRMKQLSLQCQMTCEDNALPGKGDTLCNRTACQTETHVVFYNPIMGKKYCLNCATDIRFCNDLEDLDLYPEYNESLDKLFEDNAE